MNDFQPPAGGFGAGTEPALGPGFGYGPNGPMIARPSQRLAVIACVLGCASIPTLMFGIGLPFAIAAMISAHRARAQIKREPHLYAGHGLALAGFWTGFAALVLVVLYFVLMVLSLFLIEER